ncbi:glycosyltransferase family 2 protein [Fructobacillus durionis]|uniref:Glycosyltransferase involved in cell wall bisynthesis n=1 Tax=Fructobacillus durionis TaxID=283737 RepID=A0A1I1E254_9LACO|nr:glycosyltransferase family 2 protein [Fructobacillus durionis]SFB81349.1 Glycosyltransferase involved in cell wall bisynthesis [Fructobacillus durionis]
MVNHCKRLIVVVPAYNESQIIKKSVTKLSEVLKHLIDQQLVSKESKLLFVNDGSEDDTWDQLISFHKENSLVTAINFSRNFGHQNAIIGGLTEAYDYGDIFITIDADLQDDPWAIVEMVKSYYEGFDVVYGVRESRTTDTLFKRSTAGLFYTLMSKLGVKMVPEAADFRLTSKRVVKQLLSYSERNLFLRGIVPDIGFPSTNVYYSRKERELGETKYPLRKMIGLAWDGITSFSMAPMRFVLFLGIFSLTVSFIMLVYTLGQHIWGDTVRGWSSLMLSIWFIGGSQLIGLAIFGEYLGKVFNNTKQRPRFIVQDNLLKEGQDNA